MLDHYASGVILGLNPVNCDESDGLHDDAIADCCAGAVGSQGRFDRFGLGGNMDIQ